MAVFIYGRYFRNDEEARNYYNKKFKGMNPTLLQMIVWFFFPTLHYLEWKRYQETKEK